MMRHVALVSPRDVELPAIRPVSRSARSPAADLRAGASRRAGALGDRPPCRRGRALSSVLVAIPLLRPLRSARSRAS